MEGDGGWHYGGHGYNNWDLDAVVRLGGGGGNAALEPFQDDPILALLQPQQDVLPGALPPPQQDVIPDALPQQQQGVLPDANPWQELQGAMDLPMAADPAFADLDAFLSDPVFAAPQSPPPPSPRNEAPAPQQAPAAEPPALGKAAAEPSSDAGAGSSRPKHARRSRKDMEAKYVVTVPAPYLPSSDKWSWRKYGQKPIKGSPFPRGYYKCTSNKDCPARKQVEQSSSDPNTLIVSYTGEHCHSPPTNRNSRAGIMRSSSRAPIAAGGGGSASQPAEPQLVLPAPAAAAPPPAPPRSVYMDFGKDDDDALALQALIDDAVLAPENAFLFLNPDYVAPALVNAGGGEGNQPLPIPLENMATDVSRGTGSETDGGQAPIPTNVAMDRFFGSPWEAAWPEAAPGP